MCIVCVLFKKFLGLFVEKTLFFLLRTPFYFFAYTLVVLTKEGGELMRLSDMNLGDKSYVTSISPNLGISRRLLDIGLIPRYQSGMCPFKSCKQPQSLYDKRGCYCY